MSQADFIRRVTTMVKRIPGVTDNIIDTFIEPDLTGLVNEYCQWSEKVEEDLRQQRELIRVLMQKTSLLEKRLKQSIMSQRRREYNVVKNNVIVKSQKDTSEVKKFIANVVELGGGAKLVQKKLPDSKIVIEGSNDPRSYRQCSDLLIKLGFKPEKNVSNAIEEIIRAYKNNELYDGDNAYTVKTLKNLEIK